MSDARGKNTSGVLVGRGTALPGARLLIAAAAALIAALALTAATPAPATAQTTTQSTTCQDPFETSEANLVIGQPLTRGLCEPDGRASGGDKDFFGFAAQAGKSYRIELIERGPGWDGARLLIEDFYAAGSQVSFGGGGNAYSTVTLPMPAGADGALFSVEALDTSSSDFRTLAGPDFSYTILVTEVEGSPVASEPVASEPTASEPTASEPTASGGSKKNKK